MITDTHTHLYSEQFDNDRTEMMKRAKNAGISRFFVPAIDSSYTESFEVEKGDIAVFTNGGHGYKILADNTKILETKNGPFYGVQKDKTRF